MDTSGSLTVLFVPEITVFTILVVGCVGEGEKQNSPPKPSSIEGVMAGSMLEETGEEEKTAAIAFLVGLDNVLQTQILNSGN